MIIEKKLIEYCINETNDVSLYNEILHRISLLNLLCDNSIFSMEPIIYYCHKYNIIKTNLDNYNFEQKKSPIDYTLDEKQHIYAGLVEIEYKLYKFKKQLLNIIYHNLSERHII